MNHLASWCSSNNLELNSQKTVEMVMDFRKVTAPLPPLNLTDSPISTVDSFHFLGTIITPSVGTCHQLLHQKGPAEDVLPAAAEEAQVAN